MTETVSRAMLEKNLQDLVGLRLSITREAGDMRGFHFGSIRPHSSGQGTTGSHMLHVQCSWRITGPSGIVTGLMDRFFSAKDDVEPDEGDRRAGNLQRARLFELMQGYDQDTFSTINATDHLVVTGVTLDDHCGLDIALSGGYRLQVFPDCSRDEDWRFFSVAGPHFVVEGGRLTEGGGIAPPKPPVSRVGAVQADGEMTF